MRKSIVRFVAITGLLVLWYVATKGTSGLDRLTAPSPEAVLKVARNQADTIAKYTFNTLARVLLGYFIGALVGVATALAMLYDETLAALLDSYIELIRPVPPIALTPFFLFWFGVGNTGQIVLIAMVAFLVFTVALYELGSAFEVKFIRAARLLGANRRNILFRIILPGSLGHLAGPARVALAGALSVTVAAEYLGAQGGLGYMIRNARVTLETDAILLAIILLGVCSFVMDRVVREIFARATKWMPRDVPPTT